MAWPSFWRQRPCLRRDLLSEADQWESRNGFRFSLEATVLVACLDASGAFLAKEIILHCGNRLARSAPWDWLVVSALAYLRREQVDSGTISLLLHRNGLERYAREPMEFLLSRYCETAECYDIRDRIFSVLSLASEFEGRESEIADYSLDVPHLFLGLLAFCKPDATATFAAHCKILSKRASGIFYHFGTSLFSKLRISILLAPS